MNRLSKLLLMFAFVLGLSITPLYSSQACCPCDGGASSVEAPQTSAALNGQGSHHHPLASFARQTLQIVAAQQTAMLINWSYTQLKTAIAGTGAKKEGNSCCAHKPVTEEERRTGIHLLLQTYNQKVAGLEHEDKTLRGQLIVTSQDSTGYKYIHEAVLKNSAELDQARAKRDGFLATYEKLMATPAAKHHNHKH